MKKLLCLILAICLSVSFMVGCKKDEEASDETITEPIGTEATVPENEETAEPEDVGTVTEKVPGSTSVTPDATDEPVYYILTDAKTSEESVGYHKKDCQVIKGRQTQEMSWDMISMLGFRHCAKCNPPKYQGYIE